MSSVLGERRVRATVIDIVIPDTTRPWAGASERSYSAREGVGRRRSEGISIFVSSLEQLGNCGLRTECYVFAHITAVETIDTEDSNVFVFFRYVPCKHSSCLVERSGENEAAEMHNESVQMISRRSLGCS